jgi:hypothetical protein
MTFEEEVRSSLNSIFNRLSAIENNMAGRCAVEQVKIERVNKDLDYLFAKVRHIPAWIITGTVAIGFLLSLFYFLDRIRPPRHPYTQTQEGK